MTTVRFWRMTLKKALVLVGGSSRKTVRFRAVASPSGGDEMLGHWDQLGELAKVLGCGCELELVAGTERPS